MSQPVSVRFLQISDVHLGASLADSRLGWPPALARRRAEEVFTAFASALRLADTEACHGVLIPGDLFDGDEVDDALAAAAFAAIRELAPRPVFLAPGNHDCYGPDGPYGQARWSLLAAGEGPPPNLVLWRDERFHTVVWPGRPDVTVTGSAYLRPARVHERRLAQPVVDPATLDPAHVHLALLHGSRDDHGFLQARKATLPFSAAELAAQPFDYTAVGHYHASSPIRDPGTQEVRGGYSGMPAFINMDEDGEKSVLIVEVTVVPGEPRRREVRVQRRVVDPRRLWRLEIDVTGRGDAEQVRAALARSWEQAGVRPADVAVVRFAGRLAAELSREGLRETATDWARGRCWHVAVLCERLEPEIDVAPFLAGEAKTLQARFARALTERAEAAERSEDREIARRALSYGLEAIVTGRIRRRWEPDDAAPAWSPSEEGAPDDGPGGAPEAPA